MRPMTDVTGKILLILDQEVADALCCYLDEEEVFPQVVDALLKRLPAPETESEPFKMPSTTKEYIESLHVRDVTRTILLREYLNTDYLRGQDAVYQLSILPEESHPKVDGYNNYHHDLGRYWFDHNVCTEGATIVGYYHPLSGTYMETNAEMITYLISRGFIKELT